MAREIGSEFEALRREIEALRAERRESAATPADDTGVDAAEPASAHSFDVNWDEIRQVANELAKELGQVAQERPVLGMASAFVLGLLIGRIGSR